MSVNAIGSGQQSQAKVNTLATGKAKQKPGSASEVNKLNAEIKQAESDMKKTMKEAQEAAGEGTGDSTEKVQMLQNKVQMQKLSILMKQLKVKEIESPSKSTDKAVAADTATQLRVDQYVRSEDESSNPDNVYRLEKKDGAQTIVFNRPIE